MALENDGAAATPQRRLAFPALTTKATPKVTPKTDGRRSNTSTKTRGGAKTTPRRNTKKQRSVRKIVKSVAKRLSPSSAKNKIKPSFTPEECHKVSNKILALTHQLGVIPKAKQPKNLHAHLFEYNVVRSIESLVEENPHCDIFLYKDVESVELASHAARLGCSKW